MKKLILASVAALSLAGSAYAQEAVKSEEINEEITPTPEELRDFIKAIQNELKKVEADMQTDSEAMPS